MEDPKERDRKPLPILSAATGSLVRKARDPRNTDPGDAIDRALGIEPNNPLLWLEFAHLRMAEGNYSQAEGFARKAASLSSSSKDLKASAWSLVAESRRQRGQDTQAQEAGSRVDKLMAAIDPASQSTTKTSRDATIRATITAVARSQPERIGIAYEPNRKDFAVRIGSESPVTVTREAAEVALGKEGLRKLDATLQAERVFSGDDLGGLSESIVRRRFIPVSTRSALAQVALENTAGQTDINTLTPREVMQRLTGAPSASIALSDAKAQQLPVIYNQLKRAIEDGSPITLRTQAESAGAKQDTLIDNHTYTLIGVKHDDHSDKYELTLRNPWGNEKRADLDALIKSGGLDSFTIGAARLQQTPREIRRVGPASQSEETRRTAQLLEALSIESFKPGATLQDMFGAVTKFATALRDVEPSVAAKTEVTAPQVPLDQPSVSKGRGRSL